MFQTRWLWVLVAVAFAFGCGGDDGGDADSTDTTDTTDATDSDDVDDGEVVLESIAISPPSPSITAGALIQLEATGMLSDGTTMDLTPMVTWSSTVPEVATVSATGKVTSLTIGSTMIRAQLNAVVGMVNLNAVAFNRGLMGFDGQVHALIDAPDGSGDIYVGGVFGSYLGQSSPGLIRLHSDGSIAATFNVGTGFLNTIVYALAAAPDASGDIYVGGAFTSYNGTSATGLIRLNDDGTADPAFVPGFGSGLAFVYSLLAAPDGSGDVVVGGQFSAYNGAPASAIVRVNSDGSRDATFNVGTGFTSLSTTPGVYALAASGANDIYAGGIFDHYNTATEAPGLVRLRPNGTIDAPFSAALPADAFENGSGPQIRTIVPNGTGLYIGGSFQAYSAQGVPRHINLVQLNGDGTVNPTLETARGVETNAVFDVALAPDGSGDLIVGGFFNTYRAVDIQNPGVSVDDLLRVNADGTFVGTFNSGDRFHYLQQQAVNVLLPITDGSGDVYVGGYFQTIGTTDARYLVRMSPTGLIR